MADTVTQRQASQTRGRNGNTLPVRFTPRFWEDSDRRVALVRAVQERVEALKRDTASDSVQKQTLCERAVFLATVLETSEVNAIEGVRPLDTGSYVQALNSLLGILKALGLDRKAKSLGLAKFVAQVDAADAEPQGAAA